MKFEIKGRQGCLYLGFLALCAIYSLLFTIQVATWYLQHYDGSRGSLIETKTYQFSVQNNKLVLQRPASSFTTSRNNSIAIYRETFVTWAKTRGQHSACPAPTNFTHAEQCGIRSRHASFKYPDNAEEHFAEIHSKLAKWGQHAAHQMHTAANYSGPWIENRWISDFLRKALEGPPCLQDTFGIYIPLFFPWVDLWVENGFHYPEGFVDALMSVLRPDVAYVTVSQGDMGISGYRELPMKKIPNILVLSAGGYGHVPIPLLKQEESMSIDHIPIHPSDRPHTFAYTGSLDHAPDNLRKKMHDNLVKSNLDYTYYYGPEWRNIMQSARFNLVPRGYGRSAYHLMETLQSKLIPIYVYSDEPWIPYKELFDSVGYRVRFEELTALAGELLRLPNSTIVQKEKQIAMLRFSHFSYAGTLLQIELFLKHGPPVADLRCQGLPKRPR